MDTTKLNQIEKNLFVFLDPAGNRAMEDWQFVRAEEIGVKYFFQSAKDSRDEKILYSFPRRHLWKYFLFLLKLRFRGESRRARNFLYVNDGILSSMFDAKNIVGYHSFARLHLPKPEKIWKKIARLAPLKLRAEQIFVVERFKYSEHSFNSPEADALNKIYFMFFSNASGKLLLSCTDNFLSGCGQLIKTTANPDYAKVMEKEFDRMSEVSLLLGKSKIIPAVGHRFSINGRYFYKENYIHGQSLLKVLRDLGRKGDVETFYEQIDKLDLWFKCYISIFNGERKSISQIYQPIVEAFSGIYCMNPHTNSIIKKASRILAEIDKFHPGFVCIVSHNDLWPGNFICHAEGLTAVDWERATVNRAPLFDYYWMMISAVLTFLLSRISRNDYSLAFRQFFMNMHDSCIFVHNKLKAYLHNLGISEKYHNDILLLFLLELSTQGYTAIGTQTSMDKFVFEELIEFENK